MGFFDSFNKAYNEEYKKQNEKLERLCEKHEDDQKRFERYNKMKDSELSDQ